MFCISTLHRRCDKRNEDERRNKKVFFLFNVLLHFLFFLQRCVDINLLKISYLKVTFFFYFLVLLSGWLTSYEWVSRRCLYQ